MDAKLLRSTGIAVGAAALAGALSVSQMARQEHEASPPLGVVAPQTEAPIFEPAGAEAPPDAAPISILVRFRGTGPLAQAQGLAERGREAEARRAAAAALARQSAFQGLCFDRFTVGGAEMVLRTCAPVASVEQAEVMNQWLTRLRAMSVIVYAEPNAIIDPAQAQ
ncbi:MAG: hypothetical protein NW206_11480 [Hyphomonadaceae bacterium]|nr:hypothetical protein [Hyphomonadaceae bacterium]